MLHSHYEGTGVATGHRTLTSAIPRPHASVITMATERVAGFEPASSAWKAEALPLDDTRLVRPTGVFGLPEVNSGSPHDARSPSRSRGRSDDDGAVGCGFHTQAERGSALADPSTSFSCQRPRSFRVWWAARDSNPRAPAWGERGYGPPADHPLVLPYGDSARIRRHRVPELAGRSRSDRPTRTHETWRLGCFRYTTLPLTSSRLLSTFFLNTPPLVEKDTSPVRPRPDPFGCQAKMKKAS